MTGSRNITWAIVGDSNNVLETINIVVVISVLEVSVHIRIATKIYLLKI